MKRLFLTLLVCVIPLTSLSSCQLNQSQDEGFTSIRFVSDIVVDGTSLLWQDGDCISLYNGIADPLNRGTKMSFASSKGDVKSATFKGFIPESSMYYAVWPYENLIRWSEKGTPSFLFELKSVQHALESAAGISRNDHVFVSSSATTEGRMTFSSAAPLLKISFDSDSPLTSSISVESVSKKNLTGKFSADLAAGSMEYISDGSSKVVLSSFDGECPFNEGSYYLAIASGDYPDGDLTITYNYTNGRSKTESLSIPSSLKSGSVYDCGTVESSEESGDGTIDNPGYGKIENKYDIYLCIGQSNMAGRGYLTASDKNKTIDKVFLLGPDGEPVPATHPFNQYSTIRKEIDMQQMHLGYSFSVVMTSEENTRPVLLVCNARGGTSITEWTKGTYYYAEAVNRTLLAMRYGTLKGILWHQGCADSSKRVDVYLDLLESLVSDLRDDFGIPDLPIVVGELPYWRSTSGQFNEMINNVSSQIEHSSCVSADGCGMRKDETDPHFSREALNLLGKRYAEQMKRHLNGYYD